ncbi:hypothetical protein K501DRAFT_281607 [Backusella circina FSU 941]|nr:hypothetical protein K501DRAFT_281607 [Backusella circina FSU 941]
MASTQGLVHFNQAAYPITADRLSQLKNWAMVWMYSTPKQQDNKEPEVIVEKPILLDKTFLYHATFQKLRPRNKYNLLPLGGIIQIRKCLDTLEEEIYHEASQTPSYVPPSKRLPPLNPDKLARKRTVYRYKRRSFASSTLVYICSGSTVRIQPIQTIQNDDDDVPLGKLVFPTSRFQC